MQGIRVRDLERLGADVLAGILPRIYPQVLAVAHEHQDAGRRVYIVTAASQELAAAARGGACARRRDRLCSSRRWRTASTPGVPTGLFIYGAAKATAIEELARREQLDLSKSYAYSDSASDLPMLRAVGHPVAVNPDAALLRIAREEGWDVLRFERLGRRLKAAVGLAAAGVTGGVGSAALIARGRRRTLTDSVPSVRRSRRRRIVPGKRR